MVRAFEELRTLVRARAVLHVRQCRGSRDTRSAARDEPTSGQLFAHPPRSFAASVLGEHLHSARPGSVWFLSDTRPDRDTRSSLDRDDITDIAIVPLENAAAFSDFLEIEFSERIPGHDQVLLEMLCPLIAEAWQARDPGAVAAMMAGRVSRIARKRSATEVTPIPDADNPAGLTRAEFKVCLLIHEGRMPEDIAGALNVKKSTLRSHMRSIYNKTGVSGQLELVHRLHGARASGTGGT